MSDPIYLLDELEAADMLEIDGLHAARFQLDESLLDEADAAAEAGLPFESEAVVLSVEAVDGRDRKRWTFSYNDVMEAEYDKTQGGWNVKGHRLFCYEAVGAESDD